MATAKTTTTKKKQQQIISIKTRNVNKNALVTTFVSIQTAYACIIQNIEHVRFATSVQRRHFTYLNFPNERDREREKEEKTEIGR